MFKVYASHMYTYICDIASAKLLQIALAKVLHDVVHSHHLYKACEALRLRRRLFRIVAFSWSISGDAQVHTQNFLIGLCSTPASRGN